MNEHKTKTPHTTNESSPLPADSDALGEKGCVEEQPGESQTSRKEKTAASRFRFWGVLALLGLMIVLGLFAVNRGLPIYQPQMTGTADFLRPLLLFCAGILLCVLTYKIILFIKQHFLGITILVVVGLGLGVLINFYIQTQRRIQLVDQIMAEEVDPALEQLRLKNLEAKERALEFFQDQYSVYYDRTDEFADSLLGPIDSLATAIRGKKESLKNGTKIFSLTAISRSCWKPYRISLSRMWKPTQMSF